MPIVAAAAVPGSLAILSGAGEPNVIVTHGGDLVRELDLKRNRVSSDEL